MTYAAAPMAEVQYVNELGQPCTADGQPLQFVNELGQPCTADGQPLGEVQYVNELGQPCTADGQLLGDVQYVNEFGQPCTADGQLLGVTVPMQYAVPFQSGAAARFNITPEQFAIIAQGDSLPQEQLESLLASSVPATAGAATTIAAPETAAA